MRMECSAGPTWSWSAEGGGALGMQRLPAGLRLVGWVPPPEGCRECVFLRKQILGRNRTITEPRGEGATFREVLGSQKKQYVITPFLSLWGIVYLPFFYKKEQKKCSWRWPCFLHFHSITPHFCLTKIKSVAPKDKNQPNQFGHSRDCHVQNHSTALIRIGQRRPKAVRRPPPPPPPRGWCTPLPRHRGGAPARERRRGRRRGRPWRRGC